MNRSGVYLTGRNAIAIAGLLVLSLSGCIETAVQQPGTPGDSDFAVGAGTATQLPGDALVPGTRFNATGNVACTLGGRNQRCDYGVVRSGNGDGTVFITQPASPSRQIVFVAGRPVSSNGGQVFGEWSGDTVIVTVGGSERYAIPEGVIFGG